MADLDALTDAFFDAYCQAYAPLRTVHDADLHESLLAGAPDAQGWVAWKPLRHEGPPPDYAALERVAGASLPPSYQRWHSRYRTLDLDLGPFTLLGSPLPDPLDPLRCALLEPDWANRLRHLKLIPFGREGVHDAGPLCFDGRSPGPDGELAVIYWVADRWDQDDPDAPADEEIGPVIFSSFERLLTCAVHLLSAPVGDPVERARRILDFPRLDPEGAGSEAGFTYWVSYAGSLAGQGNLPEEALAPPPDLVRRWASQHTPEGFAAQHRHVQHATQVMPRDPALALELLQHVDDPSLRPRATATRIRCLHALGRPQAVEAELIPLCEEWLGPANPNSANQHIDREEMLALTGLCPTPRINELRAQLVSSSDPDLALPDGDFL